MNKLKIGLCARSPPLPTRRALAEAHRMGALGVELDAAGDFAPDNLSQTGRRELRHLLASNDLELSALGCPLRHGLDVADNQEARIDHIRNVMTMAFDLGPRLVVVHPGKVPADDNDPRRQRLNEALMAVGRHGDRIGVTLALETGLDDAAVVESLLSRFDTGSVAVNYNPGNLVMNGFDPYQGARAMSRRIVHAHAKDGRTASASRTAQEVPLGHGDIDWLAILGVLEEIGYRGWLAIERHGSPNPLAELAASVAFLRRLKGE